MPTLQEAYDTALKAYGAGQYAQAEHICRIINNAVPEHQPALRLLGAAVFQQGRSAEAIEKFQAATAAAPDFPDVHYDLGVAQRASGKLSAAAASFHRALQLKPASPEVFLALVDSTLRSREKPDELRLEVLLAPPLKLGRVQIEITTWCNLKCAECPRTIAIGQGSWTDKHMRLDDYRRIIENSLPATILALQGVGEPTLHPDLLQMIEIAHAAKKFQYITFNTNAIGRGVGHYKKLKAAGLTHISVSVDSLDQKIADACRLGTKVDKLAQRITELLPIFPNLLVTLVASRLNLADIPATVAKLHGLGCPTVEIQPAINYKPIVAGTVDNSLSAADIDQFNRYLPELKAANPKMRILFAAPITMAQTDTRCTRPFTAPYITIDGFLTPCCTAYDPAELGHTSVADTSMAEAWRQPGVANWLKSYFEREPEICVGCCFNPATGSPKN